VPYGDTRTSAFTIAADFLARNLKAEIQFVQAPIPFERPSMGIAEASQNR
jgi:hypothetical protein